METDNINFDVTPEHIDSLVENNIELYHAVDKFDFNIFEF